MLLDDWQSRGVAFVTMGEGIDTSTPAGRLVAGVLASIADYAERQIMRSDRAGGPVFWARQRAVLRISPALAAMR